MAGRYGRAARTVTRTGQTRTFAPDEIRFVAAAAVAVAADGGRFSGRDGASARAVSSYTLVPLLDDQELDSRSSTGTIYWEGAVRAQQGGREVGKGYLELTGYWKPLQM